MHFLPLLNNSCQRCTLLQLFGFFGGVHLAVLAAFICLRHPYASLGALISIFFHVFAHWEWPTPVILHNGFISSTIRSEIRSFMPIQLPCSPHEFCHSNITRSTFSKIRAEFLRGHYLTKVYFVFQMDTMFVTQHLCFLGNYLCKSFHKMKLKWECNLLLHPRIKPNAIPIKYVDLIAELFFWHSRIFWNQILTGVAYLSSFLTQRDTRGLLKYAFPLLIKKG